MILYPFVESFPEAVAALPLDAVQVEIDPSDPTAYANHLCQAWLWINDLIVVEHDVVIHETVIPQFDRCSQPWCVFPYPGPGGEMIAELGCVRFSKKLKDALPGLMEQSAAVGYEDGGPVPAGDWRRLDIRLRNTLEGLGHARHFHYPAVRHLHDY